MPFQYIHKECFGTDGDGSRSYVNIQPVIPISIGADWHAISHTIIPVVWQADIVPDMGDQFGLGNTLQSRFRSLKRPTATDGIVFNQWGLGVMALGLKRQDGWIYDAPAKPRLDRHRQQPLR